MDIHQQLWGWVYMRSCAWPSRRKVSTTYSIPSLWNYTKCIYVLTPAVHRLHSRVYCTMVLHTSETYICLWERQCFTHFSTIKTFFRFFLWDIIISPGTKWPSFRIIISQGQNGRHFLEDIFKCTSMIKNCWIPIFEFHWSLFLTDLLTVSQHWFR